ncbi:MAG: hypothetical protein LBH93_01190 [Chitinispirillales bacterium]|nr:hypothetical protein [Chitinispirillales bacterium]
MFAKKRGAPWFVRALLNLAAASLIYRLACGFQRHAQRQGVVIKYKTKG